MKGIRIVKSGREVKEDLCDKAVFEQRPEGSEGAMSEGRAL